MGITTPVRCDPRTGRGCCPGATPAAAARWRCGVRVGQDGSLGQPRSTGAMVEEHVQGAADEDGPAAPFLSRADQPFEPAPEGLDDAARIARALEYIAYQLYHVREALGELAAAAE